MTVICPLTAAAMAGSTRAVPGAYSMTRPPWLETTNAVRPGRHSRLGVGHGHDALKDEFASGLMDFGNNGGQFLEGFGPHGVPHLAQGNQPGGVDIHAHDFTAGGVAALKFCVEFRAFPGFDEGNAVAIGRADGGKGGLGNDRGDAVAGTADDAGLFAALAPRPSRSLLP